MVRSWLLFAASASSARCSPRGCAKPRAAVDDAGGIGGNGTDDLADPTTSPPDLAVAPRCGDGVCDAVERRGVRQLPVGLRRLRLPDGLRRLQQRPRRRLRDAAQHAAELRRLQPCLPAGRRHQRLRAAGHELRLPADLRRHARRLQPESRRRLRGRPVGPEQLRRLRPRLHQRRTAPPPASPTGTGWACNPTCTAPYGACAADKSGGCTTNVGNDPANCGACGRACSTASTTGVACAGGAVHAELRRALQRLLRPGGARRRRRLRDQRHRRSGRERQRVRAASTATPTRAAPRPSPPIASCRPATPTPSTSTPRKARTPASPARRSRTPRSCSVNAPAGVELNLQLQRQQLRQQLEERPRRRHLRHLVRHLRRQRRPRLVLPGLWDQRRQQLPGLHAQHYLRVRGQRADGLHQAELLTPPPGFPVPLRSRFPARLRAVSRARDRRAVLGAAGDGYPLADSLDSGSGSGSGNRVGGITGSARRGPPARRC